MRFSSSVGCVERKHTGKGRRQSRHSLALSSRSRFARYAKRVAISRGTGWLLFRYPELKELSMIKCVVALAVMVLALNASAEVFKCNGRDGKVQFSDTPCKAGGVSEIIPERMPVTQQQRQEAQQRALQMQSEAAALEENKAIAQDNHRASQQRHGTESEKTTAVSRAAANDADAITSCVRDVERQGASQNLKAELIAACRTAGTAQGSRDMATDKVGECVRSVERTGASEAEKARQLAICHGGDVRPQFLPVPAQRNGSPRNG